MVDAKLPLLQKITKRRVGMQGRYIESAGPEKSTRPTFDEYLILEIFSGLIIENARLQNTQCIVRK